MWVRVIYTNRDDLKAAPSLKVPFHHSDDLGNLGLQKWWITLKKKQKKQTN